MTLYWAMNSVPLYVSMHCRKLWPPIGAGLLRASSKILKQSLLVKLLVRSKQSTQLILKAPVCFLST